MERADLVIAIRSMGCWYRLHDALMSGLAHDLAGRAAALHSLALVGRRGPPTEGFVLDELEAETEKLARIGGAVRSLVDGSERKAAPDPESSLGPLLHEAIEVLRLHHLIEGDELRCEVQERTPAVHAPAAELTRLLLLLTADIAARGTGRIGVTSAPHASGSTVLVEASLDPTDSPSLSHTVHGSAAPAGSSVDGEATTDGSDAVLSSTDVEHLGGAVRSWGGTLESTETGWRVSLPGGAEGGQV